MLFLSLLGGLPNISSPPHGAHQTIVQSFTGLFMSFCGWAILPWEQGIKMVFGTSVGGCVSSDHTAEAAKVQRNSLLGHAQRSPSAHVLHPA